MESFFKRHFRKKTTSSGARRTSVVALPASKARRRSLVGQPSATLIQHRRRSSAQLQGLSCWRSQRKPSLSPRRRSSTTTPRLSPRFAVQRKRGGRVRTIDTQLVGPSLLLASLIQVCEEKERWYSPCTESSSSESPREGLEESDQSEEAASSDSEGTGLKVEQERWKDLQTEPSKCTCPPVQYLSSLRPLLRGPCCVRRRSSHLLPAEFVHSKITYGLQGYHRRFSQQRRMSETPKAVAVLQPFRRRRAARRWKVSAGTRWLSVTKHKCLGMDPAHRICGSGPCEGVSILLPYVWHLQEEVLFVDGGGGICENWPE